MIYAPLPFHQLELLTSFWCHRVMNWGQWGEGENGLDWLGWRKNTSGVCYVGRDGAVGSYSLRGVGVRSEDEAEGIFFWFGNKIREKYVEIN